METMIPEVHDVEVTMGNGDVIPEMLEEAYKLGFDSQYDPYNKLFASLFFGGAKKQPVFKKNLDPEFKDRAMRFLQASMRSFESKHQHKTAVCALLLSELVEEPKED